MSTSTINFLIQNKDLLSVVIGLIGVVLTILGWFFVFLLNLQQQKKYLRNSAKMKVYEELYNLKKDIDEISTILGLSLAKFSLPFLVMSFEKDPSPATANLNALQHWNKFILELSENTYKFTNAYLKLWNHSDMWIGVMPQVKMAKKELFEIQFNNLSEKLREYQRYLQNQSIKEFFWQKWDREEIKYRAEEIETLFNKIAIGYLDDYLGIIHNRLVTPIFGYKKIPRENFVNINKLEHYFILTESGLKKVLVKK